MICVLSCVAILVITYIFVDRVLRSFKVGNYGDKYVLVTGCDSGFGQSLAVRLDSLGFHVFAGCLTEDGREYLSKNCSKRLVTVLLDVSQNESIEAALQLVKRTLPQDKGLWGLVNNAGIVGMMGITELCQHQDYVKVIGVNLLGTIEMTRSFLPLIRKGQGRVINTSSLAGRKAVFGAPYTISKYGIEAYSDLLRLELYLRGVRVILIEPGAFQTPIFTLDPVIGPVETRFAQATQDIKECYGDVAGKFRSMMVALKDSGSKDISPVVNAYIHGLTSRFPKTRYSVGKGATLNILCSYLPSCLTDWYYHYK